MKKLLYILLALCAISCTQSNEDKITSAFKEYVSNNFDDPSSLDEIVSVEVTDTVSKRGLIDIIDEYKQLSELSDSLGKCIIDSVVQLSFVNGNLNGSSTQALKKAMRNKEYNALTDKIEVLTISLIDLANNFNPDYYYEKLCDTKDTMVINYVLKYRTKTNGTKKINSIYVRTDSLLNKIEFYKNDSPLGASGIGELSDNAGELLNFYNKYLNIREELLNTERKMLRELELLSE